MVHEDNAAADRTRGVGETVNVALPDQYRQCGSCRQRDAAALPDISGDELRGLIPWERDHRCGRITGPEAVSGEFAVM
ncbi:hypothetical protein [Xylella fastidiosa]|uniref:hypothetical protein n=1 Tax=Xylella fastidiosa TaxID=2371 RepID=UPI003AFB373A